MPKIKNKRNIMKKIVLAVIIALTSIYSKAQLYSSEACFYIKAGENLSNTKYIAVVLLKGKNLYTLYSTSTITNYIMTDKKTDGIKNKGKVIEWGGVMDYLKEDPEYYDNLHNCMNHHSWKYDMSLSTSKRTVYKRFNPYNDGRGVFLSEPAHTTYLAVSQDLSSIIQWSERDGEIMGEKTYYVRIDKEELLPKTINRDFLYE